MNFTVANLKKIINEMPDEATISGLQFGDKLQDYSYLKRILLLENPDGGKEIIFNPMGTHYFDLVEKEGYKYINHWDNF